MIFIGYTDYYDYITSIYGIDCDVVYKRIPKEYNRDELLNSLTVCSPCPEFAQFYICLCGIAYPCLYSKKSGNFYYGDDITKLKKVKRRLKNIVPYNSKYVYISDSDKRYHILVNPFKTSINDDENCPVILCRDIDFNYGDLIVTNPIKNPLLKDFNFSQVMAPDNCYQSVYNWLLENKNESRVDILTDKEKTIQKGFDAKKSFRHRK